MSSGRRPSRLHLNALGTPCLSSDVGRHQEPMDNARFALLVVDMLNDFFRQHAALSLQRDQIVAAINYLARTFRENHQPIIWVRQEFSPDLRDSFLAMRKRNLRVTIAGTDGCEILPELERDPSEKVVVKKRYSAFFGTDLDEQLRALQPTSLVIC